MSNTVTVQGQMTAETQIWVGKVNAIGGSFTSNSVAIANQLMRALKYKSYYAKLIYLLPMLGVGINAARVPLIDVMVVGAAANNSFTNSDFSEATGLQGNGVGKCLDTLIKASQLDPTTNNAGFGYWARAVNVGGWSFGSRPAQGLYGFRLDNSPNELFYYGEGDSSVVDLAFPSGAFNYYCQRSSPTSRAIYQNGNLIGSTSSSTNDSGSNGANIFLMGVDTSFTTDGQCSAAYLTTGNLLTNEIADLHLTLQTYLISPSGK